MNKKMIKLGLGATALVASMSLVACGDDSSSGSSSKASDKESSESYKTLDDAPECGKKHKDEIITVEEEDADFICNADEGEWATVVASKKKLGDCTKSMADKLAYTEDDEEYYVCKDKEWKLLGDDEEDDEKSSESKDEDKSSSSKAEDGDDEDASSSSKAEDGDDEDASSSSKTEQEVKKEVVVKIDTIAGTVIKTDTLVQHQTIIIQDTAYVTVEVTKKDENGEVVKDEEGNTVVEMELVPTAPTKALTGELACKNAMFCGKEGDTRVETTVGDENYGWWYTYTDKGDGGNTKITWPNGYDDDDSFVWPSVLATAGLKAKVTFGTAIDYPYAGLGFDLVDADDSYADITDWDGLCVIYNTAQPLYLQVKPTAEKATTGYNNPRAVLPSTDSKNKIIDIDWSFFTQENGWGKEVTTASVLKKASKITFKLSGEAGSSNTFIIYAIGKKGTCDANAVAETPDSDEPIDILNGAGEFYKSSANLKAFTTYVHEYELTGGYAGHIKYATNDEEEQVLEFYNGEDNDEAWYLQLKKLVSLKKGYSYQIFITGYDYDGDDDEFLNVNVGLQDPDTYDNLIDNDGSNWSTNHYEWESGILNNCENRTAQFYVNGGMNEDDGFAIKSLKIIQTPISSCK